MADRPRAIREALLDAARRRSERLRLLCRIAAPSGSAALARLPLVASGLAALPVRALDLELRTTDATPAGLAGLAAAILPDARIAVLGPEAPEPESDAADLVLDLDGTAIFTAQHLIYWLAARAALAPLGLAPGFLRLAPTEAGLRAIDAAEPTEIATGAGWGFGDWRFVRHQVGSGIRLADRDGPDPAAPTAIAIDPRSLLPRPECCLLAPGAAPGGPAPERLFRRPPSALALHRASLDETTRRVVLAAGAYRRAPPLLVDSAALDPAARAHAVAGLGRCREDYPELVMAEIADAWLLGAGTVVTEAGAIIEESCWEAFAQGRDPAGLVGDAAGALRIADRPRREIAAPALLLKRPFTRNFGHWLLDAAAALALATARGLLDGASVIVDADLPEGMAAIARETLARLAPGVPVLAHPESELWHCAALRLLWPIGRTPLFRHPEALAALRAAFAPEPDPAPRRRLFVARPEGASRQLANEAEIFALCAARGFERAEPWRLSLAAQAALFAAAEAVVAVKGAAAANLLFCRPGTAAILLSPGDWHDPVFWDLVGQNGGRYLEIFGPLADAGAAVSHNAFAIAPSSLTRALDLALPAPIAPGPALAAPVPPRAAVPPPGPDPRLPPLGGDPRLPPLGGEEYLGVLARLHAALAPRAYLEIGTLAGDTLALARCPAIAIDPAFRLDRDIAATLPLAMLFEQTSDDFFAARDPAALLGAAPALLLIDGMHRLEFALRDVIHCERHADPGGTIVLHDCVPLDLAMARRDQADPAVAAHPDHPGWWTGDVWKLVPILRRYRPDLELLVLDAPPTGLVLLRRLDPGSTVLADRYGEILAEALGEADEAAAFARHLEALDLRPTARLEALLAGG